GGPPTCSPAARSRRPPAGSAAGRPSSSAPARAPSSCSPSAARASTRSPSPSATTGSSRAAAWSRSACGDGPRRSPPARLGSVSRSLLDQRAERDRAREGTVVSQPSMSTGRSLLGLALALAAAALYAGGIALQALEARAAPPERALRLALLRHLVRRPRWVAGTLAGLAGWALQATALLVAPLTLVQPALPAGLVLLLPLGKRALGEPVRRREAAAVLLVAGGLAALGWAAPARDPRHASGPTLVAALAGLGALALLPYAAPRRRSAALPLAAAAGLAYAWDGLATKFFTDDLSARGWPGAALWLAGMLVASGFGTLSEMSALQAGPATRVAPVVSALTTLAVVSLAPLLAREQVPAGPLARSALLAGLAAVVLGTAAIARAPAVTGVLARGRRKASREAERPAGRSDAARRRPRVLVLTAEEGRGHTSVAGTLAAELAEEGAEVVVHDALADSLGRVIPFFTRDAYRVQLRRLSWSYGLEYLLFTRLPPGRAVARAGLALLGSRPLLRLLRRTAPDVVVSTHPTLTAVLGSLRRRGLLHVPAVATISDFGVHPLWAHPGVDLHLVVHPSCLAAVERVAGRGRARAAGGGDGRRRLGRRLGRRRDRAPRPGGGDAAGRDRRLRGRRERRPPPRARAGGGRRAAPPRPRLHRRDAGAPRRRRRPGRDRRRRDLPGGARVRLPDRRRRHAARALPRQRPRDRAGRARRARALPGRAPGGPPPRARRAGFARPRGRPLGRLPHPRRRAPPGAAARPPPPRRGDGRRRPALPQPRGLPAREPRALPAGRPRPRARAARRRRDPGARGRARRPRLRRAGAT